MLYIVVVLLFILNNSGFVVGQVYIYSNQYKYDNATILNQQTLTNNAGPAAPRNQSVPNAIPGSNPAVPSDNSASSQSKVGFTRFSPYFGVEFGPNVESRTNDQYSIDEIKKMLRVILTKSNSILTYSMGIWGNFFFNLI